MVDRYDDNFYEGLNISDRKKEAARDLLYAGWTEEQLADILINADSNGNGSASKKEVSEYIKQKYNIVSDPTAKEIYYLINSSI